MLNCAPGKFNILQLLFKVKVTLEGQKSISVQCKCVGASLSYGSIFTCSCAKSDI